MYNKEFIYFFSLLVLLSVGYLEVPFLGEKKRVGLILKININATKPEFAYSDFSWCERIWVVGTGSGLKSIPIQGKERKKKKE